MSCCKVSTHSTTVSFSSTPPFSRVAPKSNERVCVCNENQWYDETSVGIFEPE